MRLPIQRMELKQNDPFYSLKKEKNWQLINQIDK